MKYIWCKGYSAFFTSETDFLIFRRFCTCSTRITLKLQDSVGLLKEELESLDSGHEKRECEDVHNALLEMRPWGEGETVLDELKDALVEYSKQISQTS
jgi:hypothetical protein